MDGKRTQVSQLELLRRCAVVVTHGGMNSVQEALHFGAPMLLAPQAADQFWISARVAELGAGVLLEEGKLRESIEHVLAVPRFRTAAQRIGASLRAASGHTQAADVIQDFITRNPSRHRLASDSNAPVVRPGV
ncbi:MAG TPA: nucleotide disphospho-sugar-binding domain-containing protein [Bryobacteraceae bacterium]|nr:nucleotide disphospho-sugar-binding domain-containing protein [Bryobacteraceae bacterium]